MLQRSSRDKLIAKHLFCGVAASMSLSTDPAKLARPIIGILFGAIPTIVVKQVLIMFLISLFRVANFYKM